MFQKNLGRAAIVMAAIALLFQAVGAIAASTIPSFEPEIKILFAKFSDPDTLHLMQNEIIRPFNFAGQLVMPKQRTFQVVRPENKALPNGETAPDNTINPFGDVPEDFFVGDYLPRKGKPKGEPPRIDPKDLTYFSKLVEEGNLPDVFVIGGHQVISEGWHDEEERHFIFLPTLLDTLKRSPDARKVFDNVKIAIVFGCNAMTNLEPHSPKNEYLSPEKIKQAYLSGPSGKRAMTGGPDTYNSLEFYRTRLAREYGPNTEKYEYTRGPKNERCEETTDARGRRFMNCKVTDVDRVFPDEGLYDGLHRYNYPAIMKQIFPNAVLVIGFTSASPNDDKRARILSAAFEASKKELNAELAKIGKQPLENIVFPLVNPGTSAGFKKKIIQTIRKNWTIVTYDMNRQRPSGSITPAFPDLDANGIFVEPFIKGKQIPHTQLFAPYEERGGTGVGLR